MQSRFGLVFGAAFLSATVSCDSEPRADADGSTKGDAEASAKAEPKPEAEAQADADANAKPAPSDLGSKGEADLKLTGAVELALTGEIARCGATFIDGALRGGSWGITTDALTFQIIATSEEELDDPKVVLNLRKPERKSYVLAKGGKVVTPRDRTVAELDTDLRNIVDKGDVIHVAGKITCPPKQPPP